MATTRCEGTDCPVRKACKRAAEPKDGEVFLKEVPYKDGLCDYYLPADPPRRFFGKKR